MISQQQTVVEVLLHLTGFLLTGFLSNDLRTHWWPISTAQLIINYWHRTKIPPYNARFFSCFFMLYTIFMSLSSWFQPCNCWNDSKAENFNLNEPEMLRKPLKDFVPCGQVSDKLTAYCSAHKLRWNQKYLFYNLQQGKLALSSRYLYSRRSYTS